MALTQEEIIQAVADKARGAIEGDFIKLDDVERIVREKFESYLEDADPAKIRKFAFGDPNAADERLAGSKYARHQLSTSDIEFLYDMMTAMGRALPSRCSGPSEELTNAFNAVSRAYYVDQEKIREIDGRALDDMFPRIPLSYFQGKDRALAARGGWQETEAYKRAYRAMDTAESGFGSQLVGVEYVPELWEAGRLDSRIFGLLESFEMKDATSYLPVSAALPEMLLVSESAASNSSNYTTSKTGSNRVQVDAKKFVIHQMWSAELEEDAIIPFIPFLRAEAQDSIAHYSDSAVLNGDTTNAATGNINLDDADPADTKHYLAFDGIRHAGIVDNTGNSADMAGALTFAALVQPRARMYDTTYFQNWGHPVQMSDLIQVGDPETAVKVALLDEVLNSNTQRNRPLVNGEVADILGNPFISSAAMSKTEADGKVSTTAGNNTKGQVVTFNRRGLVVGIRRRVKTMVEQLPATDQVRIVYSLRMGLGRWTPTGAASGIEWADVLYNIDLS